MEAKSLSGRVTTSDTDPTFQSVKNEMHELWDDILGQGEAHFQLIDMVRKSLFLFLSLF